MGLGKWSYKVDTNTILSHPYIILKVNNFDFPQMSPSFFFFILLSLPLLSSAITAYEALEQFDFPSGLLPVGVTGYTLNEATGEFQAYLPQTCSYSVQGYDLKYQSTISGIISKDKLTNLKGISVKVLFFWLNIVEVSRDGDELSLSVGILSAAFDISGFVDSPQCGCGFDCNGGGLIRKEKELIGKAVGF